MSNQQVSERESTLLRRADRTVREHPRASWLGAVVIGFTLGLLLQAFRPRPEFLPAQRALFRPFAKRAKKAYDSSAEAVRDVVQESRRPLARWWRRVQS